MEITQINHPMRVFFLLLLVLFAKPSQAQFSNLNWTFGDSCGIKFNLGGIDSIYKTSVKCRGSCAAISDTSGNLLFYCGSGNVPHWLAGYNQLGTIYTSSNQVMMNGDSLMVTGWYKELTILPWPGDTNLFVLLTSGIANPINPGLRYALINRKLNNGQGFVLQKNVLLYPGQIGDGLTAIRHGNGRDWWILFRVWNANVSNNIYYKILLTPNGFGSVQTQAIGDSSYPGFFRFVVNPEGTKIIGLEINGLLQSMDFDRCTGLLSNAISWHQVVQNTQDENKYWDGAFSPDGRFLYVSTHGIFSYVYQYDTYASNPFSTQTTISVLSFPDYPAGALRLAPNGKIYHAIAWNDGVNYNFPYPDSLYNQYNTHLSVINQPDSGGIACDFQAFSQYLNGYRTYLGLPNTIDYQLGPLIGSACDTLTTSLNENFNEQDVDWQLYPNPATDRLYVYNAKKFRNGLVTLRLYDQRGRMVVYLPAAQMNDLIEIPCAQLNSGLYFLQIEMEEHRIGKKIIVQHTH